MVEVAADVAQDGGVHDGPGQPAPRPPGVLPQHQDVVTAPRPGLRLYRAYTSAVMHNQLHRADPDRAIRAWSCQRNMRAGKNVQASLRPGLSASPPPGHLLPNDLPRILADELPLHEAVGGDQSPALALPLLHHQARLGAQLDHPVAAPGGLATTLVTI